MPHDLLQSRSSQTSQGWLLFLSVLFALCQAFDMSARVRRDQGTMSGAR